jgi:hypothetical protein
VIGSAVLLLFSDMRHNERPDARSDKHERSLMEKKRRFLQKSLVFRHFRWLHARVRVRG